MGTVPMARLALFLLFPLLFPSSLLCAARSFDLTGIWEADANDRQEIVPGNGPVGLVQSNGQFPASQMEEAFSRLCDKFQGGGEDSPLSLSLEEEATHFLQALNSTSLFQRAVQLFEGERGEAKGDNLLAALGSLFFSPSRELDSLFCRFSPDSASWFSFRRDQLALGPQLLEVRENEEEVLIRLRGEDGRTRKRRVLLGTSPQFELTATGLCALLGSGEGNWKRCSAPVGNGKTFLLAVKTKEVDGKLKVEAYFPRIEDKSGRGGMEMQKRPKPRPNPNPELQKLAEELWAKDEDRVAPGTISLNWQGKLRQDQVEDISPDPLFSHVDESFLQRPIYAALVEMYNEGAFHQQVCEQEPPMDEGRKEKFTKLWGLITQSGVFKTAYGYLDGKNKTGGDFDGFCAKMFDFWFGTYSRCKQRHSNEEAPLGSSGFEHVFSGEWRQGVVEGHHNWVRYYLQEKAGDINYHGYFGHDQDNYIGTFQYKWKGFLKKIGGFFFQTSPAFDFSLFSVCALTQPGNEHCQFELFQTKLFVTSFSQSCQNGTCLSTTYPGTWNSSPQKATIHIGWFIIGFLTLHWIILKNHF